MNRPSPTRWRCSSALLLAALAGCAPPHGTDATRLLKVGDAPIFSFDQISTRERIDELSLPSAAGASPWKLPDSGVKRMPEGGFEIRFEEHDAALERRLDLDATAIDGVEVLVERVRASGWVELDWWVRDGGGQPIAVRLYPSDLQGGRPGAYVFELRDRPEWRGRIDRIGVRLNGPKGSGVVVRSVELYRRRLSEEGLRRVAAGAVTATIGGRAQPALLAINRETRVFDCELPRAAELELSVSALGWSRESSRLRWSLRRASDSETIVASGEVVLPQEQRWIDLRLDLSAVPPGAARLEVTAEIAGEAARVPAAFAAGLVVRERGGRGRRPNVLVVSIDTLRADHLSLYGYGRRTSPAIDAWAATGALVFDQAFAAAPMTLASHASLFTGLGPLEHGAILDRALSARSPVLAERFRAAGYATLAVTGGGYLDPRFGLARGFDRFHYLAHEAMDPEEELRSGVATARELLHDYRERPFLLFFHTYEVHSPYNTREPYFSTWTGAKHRLSVTFRSQPPRAEDGFLDRGGLPAAVSLRGRARKLEPEEYPVVVDAYDSGVAAADHAFGEILQELAAQGLADDTIVVLLSDHGESLGEHGLFEHGYLYDDNLRVALVVRLPGTVRSLRRVGTTVRLLDLFPTLLDLAGLPPEAGIDGETLIPFFDSEARQPDRPVVSYAADSNHGLAVRARGWKWIYRDSAFAPSALREELYDLAADPGELRPIALAGSPAKEIAGLRIAGLRAVAGRRGGVRVRVRNPTGQPVTVELAAAGLVTTGAKSFDAAQEPWTVTASGALSARVEAGAELRLVLLPPLPLSAIGVRFLRGGSGAPGSELFEVPASVLCAKGSFTVPARGPGRADSQPSVLLAVEDDCASGVASPLEDAALVRQLRALGYLN